MFAYVSPVILSFELHLCSLCCFNSTGFFFFVCKVKAHGRARTLNGSGCNSRERRETPTAGLKDKIEGDLDKSWVWRVMVGRGGHTGWRRWIQKEKPREFGRRTTLALVWEGRGVDEGRKDCGYRWGDEQPS